MSELPRLLLLVAIAGSAVTFMGSAAIWFMDEDRRIRRALRHVLRGAPEVVILAHGRGRGAGFSFDTGLAAVAWDSGAWCLIYRIDEVMGAELLVDGQVAGRVFRGEARRAVDHVAPQAAKVTLRLIFDDPRHPDFDLDLWAPGDEQRRESRSPADAVQEANRWLARCEAIVRRPQAPRPRPEAAAPPPPPPPPPEPRPEPRPAPSSRAPLPPPDDDFDDVETELPFDEPPWDPDPPAAPVFKPISKARREARSDQDDLPFDLDD
ncbi:hypothetical protein [Caulobacter sp.]|uniref:hypothetical protein n=1 Tax=Caulobacter sp. TaxID=78 RepID=UPI003BACEA10